MPIKVPDDLPAIQAMIDDGIIVIKQHDALHQDIRPIRVALLNLMPQKKETEKQLARLLGSTPLQIELILLKMDGHQSKNTDQAHMDSFYYNWSEVKDQYFDGLIITGAPIEKLDFHEVSYWETLCEIFTWSQTNVFQTLALCWGAQAALKHFYNIDKHLLPQKYWGVFHHYLTHRHRRHSLTVGLDDNSYIPVSRHTNIMAQDLQDHHIDILIQSNDTGVCMAYDEDTRATYLFNHPEYDTDSLRYEYEREFTHNNSTIHPINYFTDDDPNKPVINRWRCHSYMLFANWINHIYQNTSFNAQHITPTSHHAQIPPNHII